MLEKRELEQVNQDCECTDDKLSSREYPSENHLCFYKITEIMTSKNLFAEECRKLDWEKFEWFRSLFSVIDSIGKE